MASELHRWRDALRDLGVIGLVPPPYQPEPDPPSPEPPPLPRAEAVRALPPPLPRVEKTAPSGPDPSDPKAFPPAEAVTSAASLSDLEACIQGCLACPLGAGRIRFVFGEGSPAAKVLLVGEGPGRTEDLQGRPFVGEAGQLLDRMLGSVGLARTEVYICNVVKCRPPDNRTPTGAESQACLGYLRRQIELVRPQVIVTLGATPLRELLGLAAGITKVRGQWQTLPMLGGIPVMPTYHPAYVLRQYTEKVRREVWEDLKAVRKWLDGRE